METGDIIRIDTTEGVRAIDLHVDDETLARRRAALAAAPARKLSGAMEKYANAVQSAYFGAITHSGNAEWPFEDAQDD